MKTLPFLLLLILIGCSKDPLFTDAGTFTDSRDNHIYKSVKIGEQTWMAENLAYLPTVSPSSNGSETSNSGEDASYYYVNDYQGNIVSDAKATANYSTYGALYNWEAAKSACPSGWHLPSDEEWQTLEIYLGMSQSVAFDSDVYRNSGRVGEKMKSATGWSENGHGDNSSGFNALPSGQRENKGFLNLGITADFTSSTAYPYEPLFAWYRILTYKSIGVFRNGYDSSDGFSVRCLKDQ